LVWGCGVKINDFWELEIIYKSGWIDNQC